MKSHDWIFLMFTTIICCTTLITTAQAQQRGRVRFGSPMQKDDADTNSSPEVVSLSNQARGSASHQRASSRFRAPNPSAIPSIIEEIIKEEPPRPVQRASRGRAVNDRSSRKLTAEATEAIPLVRSSRKRINPVTPSSDQPTKVELPTSSVDRTNVIRRSKTRSEPPASSSPPTISSSSSGNIRRRSDAPPSPSPDVSTESVRKVRTFTSRSPTKQTDEVVSSESPLTVATTGSSWRNVALKRGASKVKSSERKSKALVDDQLEDENYPEHFKLLLRKQQPSQALLPKNYPKLPVQEDQVYSKLNEIYEAPKSQGRSRRVEQTSQETSDEILQVSRAIPKVRRVELKREDTARAALKTRRIEPRLGENKENALRIEEPPKPRRSDAEKLRAQVKINKAAIKSRKREPQNEVQREDIIPKVPSKPNKRTESSTEDNGPEVKPNEIEESTKGTKPLFLPRRAEPYRPKPKTTTQRPTTTSKPIKKPEVLAARAKFKNRFNSRLQFPSLKTKTSSTPDEAVKYDNEIVHTSPAPQPPLVRPLQITKSRNLALDRPVVDPRNKPKQQKFSSRYRGDAFSRYQQKTEPSKPIYTPTIPALTTEPIPPQPDQIITNNIENQDLNKSGSNFEGIVYDGTAGVWNMIEPVAGGLTRSEISVESGGDEQPLPQSSVTVSIFEALADILSKTQSTTSTTTTTTTTSTTTSTTELPDIIQVPEQKNDSMSIVSSSTVNTHDPITTDVMDDENTTTTTNAITNNDRDGRLLNSVEINPSTTTNPNPTIESSKTTTTVPQDTSDTTMLLRSQTQTTSPELTDLTTLPPSTASPTQPTLTNTNLTNISTNLLELTTLASNPPTSLPMPFLADALTTPGSSLITRPQLISAISNFLDTSVQNASETMATTTENTSETTTTATLETNSTPSDASTTLSPPITTTFSPPSTGSPPVTISFLDLFTIQAKKVNQNTEPAVEVHPIYKGPEPTTTPEGETEKKQTTGRPVNINTFLGSQTYPSISVTGSTSTDRALELSSTFSEPTTVTGGETTDTAIPSTSTLEQDTSTFEYTSTPQSSIRTQSLPIHLNSILGSTQKYDQTSPFKTVQTEITTTIRSRFGNRRIPILPAGSVQSTTNKVLISTQTSTTKPTTTPVSTTTTTTTTTTAVTQVSPEIKQEQKQLSNSTTTTTTTTTPSTTEQKPIQDFSVYGILPNNTVVRKRPPQVSRQLDIGIMVYGILPNQTLVRKYPNGTLMIVDSSKDVEVVDIDPKMLFNPFSELYRTSQSSLLLTTHRSTTSHRLIESNHILSSSSSSNSNSNPSPSTEVSQNNNNNNSATGSGRWGNSIKATTESGNTDSTLVTNTDDENLIQWLSENEDNILNSTILVESNTENAVLLDLLKRKYIKSDLPSRSSNVVSLTTVRNVIEESSIPANKQEDVSENTLFDSSEEKKKDTVDDFFLSKGSKVPNRNNNNDDENVISKQFDTSYANVGIGSIFAGNKEPKQVDRKTTPTIYLVTPVPRTSTTELITTTESTTTPSSTTTTPSTTTTTTTTPPSTTPTTSTTESTTPSTTTPIETTTSTTTTTTTSTTTPIPTTEEITTTPRPTIIFKAPSTTSGTTVGISEGRLQTNEDLVGANSELEKNIKLLEQLLKLQASLKQKPSTSSSSSTSTTTTTTTTTPSTTTAKVKSTAASSSDDEQFLNQLRQLLLIQQQANGKSTTTTPKPTTTTSTTTTTTTTRKPITISPQNLQDLLNSFSTPSFTSTTPRPDTGSDDLEFLNSLREIGKIQITTKAPTTFANRIIELALKNRPSVKPTSPVYISTTVPPFVPMPEVKFPQILPANEVEKHRQDQASLSADLSLLSTLLGRRITIADLPQITQQFGGANRGKPAPIPVPRQTTTTTSTPRTTRTTTTTTTQRPMTKNEIAEIQNNLNLLSSLLGRPVSLNELPLIMQELRSGRKPKGTASSGATINFISPAPFKPTTTTTTTARPRPTVSLQPQLQSQSQSQPQPPLSQEEVIELLKDPSLGSPDQLNIYGNTNDAILAAVLKQRGIGPAHNNLPVNDLFGQEQTQKPYRPTRPPPPPPPQRRPVLDGLAWLWRTWQETAAPGNRVSKNNRQPTASASTRLESPLLVGAFGGETPSPTVNSNEGGEYADLQYPQNPSFGQGNGLLTAAFGVTKAVSQFLGAAFQGAAKSVQSAFSPQAIQQPSLISLSG